MRNGRLVVMVGFVIVGGLTLARCTAAPVPPAPKSDLKAIVSIKELMEDIVDPIADNIFDAVGSDIGEKGVVHIVPTTDDHWAKVRQGAVTLAEASILLKMPRVVAPPGDPDQNNSAGPNAPELSPAQIQAKIEQDRALWNSFADELGKEALKVLDVVKRKDADALFEAGGEIDRACENCHLEYWYPGDKKRVLEDADRRVMVPAPTKK